MTPQTDRIRLSDQLCVYGTGSTAESVSIDTILGESGVIIPVQEINLTLRRMHIRVGGS